MKFDFLEEVKFIHCIEVDTDNEELFEEVTDDIFDMIEDGEIEDKREIISVFNKKFGKDKVTFIEDGSGDVEIENY